jgi:hypothetical protein
MIIKNVKNKINTKNYPHFRKTETGRIKRERVRGRNPPLPGARQFIQVITGHVPNHQEGGILVSINIIFKLINHNCVHGGSK